MSGEMPDKTIVRYVIGWVVVSYAVIGICGFIEFDPFDRALGIFETIIYPIGTYYCYRMNGGAAGQQFVYRFLSIAWVVGIRVITVFLLIIIIFYTIIEPSEEPGTMLAGLALSVACDLVYIWRVGWHLSDINKKQSIGGLSDEKSN